ncbi:MAG: hypothetical protein E3J72_02870 [Planctomycetota bacterium]|nr:MAG: hypothetical protein E3J72_02870 [Planctomycetota bacterium]
MDIDSKKIAAIVSAINAYLSTEQTGFTGGNGASHTATSSAWAMAGRRDMMNLRRVWQLKLGTRMGRRTPMQRLKTT